MGYRTLASFVALALATAAHAGVLARGGRAGSRCSARASPWTPLASARAGEPAPRGLTVVNETGMNLPELALQAELALGDLASRVPAPVVLTVELLETTDLQGRNVQPLPFGPRFVMPRGYTNDLATVMVQGRVAVLPAGAVRPLARRFLGRCASWQDYEPHLATSRARRPFAGFRAYPGRLDPSGPLVVGALGNAFAAGGLETWLLILTGASQGTK